MQPARPFKQGHGVFEDGFRSMVEEREGKKSCNG